MGRPRIYENNAAKVAAFRERKQLATLSVVLPPELIAEFEEFLKFKNLTKSEVIEKLLRTQLLRKR